VFSAAGFEPATEATSALSHQFLAGEIMPTLGPEGREGGAITKP